MTNSKSLCLLVFLLLFAPILFVSVLNAQNDENIDPSVKEFVKTAQDYIKQNKIDEAIDIYERVIIAAPNDTESRKQLADLYTRKKQHEKATQIWSNLLDTDPVNETYQDNLFDSIIAAGQHNKALELIQSFIQSQPDIGKHYNRLAKLYTDQEKYDEAITNYKVAIKLGYTNKDIFLNLTDLYYLTDDLDAAEKALNNAYLYSTHYWDKQKIGSRLINLYRYQGNLEQMLEKAETDGTITTPMLREQAKLLIASGEYEKAADTYKTVLNELNNNMYERSRVIEDLLKTYIKNNNNDLALEFYETEVSGQPRLRTISSSFGTSGITVNFIGDDERETLINAYNKQGELTTLITLIEGKLQNDANNVNNIELLAESYWKNKDYQQAAELYLRLSKVEKNNIRSLILAAVAYKKTNQLDKIKQILNQADTALPNSQFKRDTSFQGALATLCLNNEMFEHAIKFANDAVNIVENQQNKWDLKYLYMILARSYQKAKRHEDAYQTYKKVIDIDEDNYLKRSANAEIDIIAKEAKLHQKWIPDQLKMVEENPNDPKLITKLAESYEATENLTEAIIQYENLSNLEPNNAQWYRKLGDLYQKQPPKRRDTGKVIKDIALNLSGNGSYAEIDDSITLNQISEQVTVSAWIKPTAYPNRYAPIIFKGDKRVPDIKNRSYILYLKKGGQIQLAASPDGAGEASLYAPPNIIQLNRWHHIAAVIDAQNNSMQLFIDGYKIGQRDFRREEFLYRSRLPLRIGSSHEEEQPAQSPFVGQIDEVKIWNIARTETEIHADMYKKLNGDEPGLIGYWNFDETTNGKITDASPNKNNGILIGDANTEEYTRPVFESLRSEQLEKSINAYETAIQLNPTSYQLYDLLATAYNRALMYPQVITTYHQALDAPLRQIDHDLIIQNIASHYTKQGQENEIIPFLEEIKPKMQNSSVLYKLLGDYYKIAGDPEKSENAYRKWFQIRKTELNNQNSSWQHLRFIDELLDKELFPDEALKLAKIAFYKEAHSGYDFTTTLGQACAVNGLYDEALKHYKFALTQINNENTFDYILNQILYLSDKVEDEELYLQKLNELTNMFPAEYANSQAKFYRLKVQLSLAEYYSKNNKRKKAMEQLQNTGIIHENNWYVLGPFDNFAGIGYNTEYISEETTSFDPKKQYDTTDEQISWKEFSDDVLDGFIDLADENHFVFYAWTTITSPVEQKAQIRYGSDTQTKIWLNGDLLLEKKKHQPADLDDIIIPVTLKSGINSLLVKIGNDRNKSGFYLRVTDSDGKPIDNLQILNTQNE